MLNDPRMKGRPAVMPPPPMDEMFSPDPAYPTPELSPEEIASMGGGDGDGLSGAPAGALDAPLPASSPLIAPPPVAGGSVPTLPTALPNDVAGTTDDGSGGGDLVDMAATPAPAPTAPMGFGEMPPIGGPEGQLGAISRKLGGRF